MSARRRLEYLERAHAKHCVICGDGGDGLITFHVTTNEPSSPFFGWARPETSPCPACGTEPTTFTITIAYGDDEGEDDDVT